MLRKAIRRAAWAAGYDVIRRPALGHNLETHLARLLPLLRINVFLDVGANDGRTGASLREHGYCGRIVSFEPGPAYTQLAQAADRDPDWLVRHQAVGADNGSATLNVAAASTFSSFHELAPLASAVFGAETATVERTEVPMRRLDSLFPELVADIPTPRVFLKSDTEGHDLEVVAGSDGCVDAIEGVLLEIAVRPVFADVPNPVDALAAMSERGFRLLRAFPDNEFHGLNVFAQNMVFVRNRDD